MVEPIQLTPEQYWTVAWMLFNFGWFYTANQIFKAPHEREYDSHSSS